jgi:DNA-binding CsgD family transcriptional regulator
MREVSVRVLDLLLDLARAAGVDESILTAKLGSVALVDGQEPGWIDWEDLIEAMERFERIVGGPDGVRKVMADASPTAYPELRALAAVFVRPVPLFTFFMTRLMPTMYRHMRVEDIERIDEHGVRWTQTIPDGYRASEAFHRYTVAMVTVLPRQLELPDARLDHFSMTPRSAELAFTFPPPPPLTLRGARVVSSVATLLGAHFDEAFAKIAETIRSPVGGDVVIANGASLDWAERLALSPRQRDVFALLVKGRANKDIAAALRCSERNIEFHVGRILRAARVSSRAELLVKVLGAEP